MVHLTLWAEPPNFLSTPSDQAASQWTSLLLRGCRVHPWVLFSGGSRGGAGGAPPPIFRPNLGDLSPSPPYLKVWIWHCYLLPKLSLFAVMAGPRQGDINWNTFYFSKYINSHDSFYWQIFHEPLTLDIFMHIKAHFCDLRLYKRTFHESFYTLAIITTKYEADNRVDSTVSVNQKVGYFKVYLETTWEMGRTVLILFD